MLREYCLTSCKALLSIFKRRQNDLRDKEGGLESCDCELQANEDQAECRLVFRLNCRQGVVKTYRLLYESGEILHAAFDQLGSTNHWTASSRTLRDVVEYFGPKTDQLDWYFESGKVTFTSYTEKIQSGRGVWYYANLVWRRTRQLTQIFRNPQTAHAHLRGVGTKRFQRFQRPRRSPHRHHGQRLPIDRRPCRNYAHSRYGKVFSWQSSHADQLR